MVRLRMFVAWIILLAVPLQGLAAATMLFCVAPEAQAAHHHAVGADHGSSAAASHTHDSGAGLADRADAEPERYAEAKPLDAGLSHACSVCAVCSQAVGITASAAIQPVSQAVQEEPATALPPMHSRFTAVDDKPPRA